MPSGGRALIAYRVARKQRACSPETSAYCQARKRLPEEFFSQIARQTGRQLDGKAKSDWLWKNRHVYIFDGATVSMPDTYENQQAYPQPPQQKPGLGFPLARIAVIFSLACGAVLDVGMCRYAGKGQSELALLRQLWSIFQPGSIMLADRLMCAWTELVMLKQRDVDSVCRFNSANRKTDFRRGTRLGKDAHLVTWFKPTKPRSIDRQTYNTLPESLTIRECRVPIAQSGFRVKVVVIATTLLDHIAVTVHALGGQSRVGPSMVGRLPKTFSVYLSRSNRIAPIAKSATPNRTIDDGSGTGLFSTVTLSMNVDRSSVAGSGSLPTNPRVCDPAVTLVVKLSRVNTSIAGVTEPNRMLSRYTSMGSGPLLTPVMARPSAKKLIVAVPA